MNNTASYVMILVMFILSANNIVVPLGCYIAAFTIIGLNLIINAVEAFVEKHGLLK